MSNLNRLISGIAALWLVACTPVPVQVSRNAPDGGSDDAKEVIVDGQKVIVTGAAGYCINARQSRYTQSGAFVVLAPCDNPAGPPPPKGLVIVNVSAAQALQDALDSDTMDGFFQSEEGLRALSARGRAEDVEILGTMVEDGMYVVHSRDASGPVIPDTSAEQWRMFLNVRDRLVSVSVINFTDAPMTDGQVFILMEAIATAIRARNNS